MDLSIFNTGNLSAPEGSEVFNTRDSFNTNRANALGQSVAPTPTQSGLPISLDNVNDTRSDLEVKMQAQQVNKDTAPDLDPSRYIVSDSGYHYDKVPDDRASMLKTSIINYMSAMMAGQSSGEALMSAGKASYAQRQMIKRQSRINELEKKGYAPIDIAKYIETGNGNDLMQNKGKLIHIGNGVMVNDVTGAQTKFDLGNGKQVAKTIDLGDRTRIIYQDGSTEEVAQGSKPIAGATFSNNTTSTGIGLDDAASNDQMPENQNGVYGTRDAKGAFKPLGEKEQAYWRDKAQAKANPNALDANQQLVTDDLSKLSSLPDSEIEKFTGHVISKSPQAQSAYAEYQGKDAQANLAASQRVSTQMGNAAIAAAKAAGASGINTEAELKRFTAGVPQVRYTSPDDYKQSLKEIQTYADNFKNQLIRAKGVTPSSSDSSSTQIHGRYNPATGKIEPVNQ